MEREGKTLKALKPGDRRRLSDARNAWRKMTPEQRVDFLEFVEAEHGVDDGAHLPKGWSIVDPGLHWTTGQ